MIHFLILEGFPEPVSPHSSLAPAAVPVHLPSKLHEEHQQVPKHTPHCPQGITVALPFPKNQSHVLQPHSVSFSLGMRNMECTVDDSLEFHGILAMSPDSNAPPQQPGPLTSQCLEGTRSTRFKSGSLGLMVSWVVPALTPWVPVFCLQGTAHTAVIISGLTLCLRGGWCPSPWQGLNCDHSKLHHSMRPAAS